MMMKTASISYTTVTVRTIVRVPIKECWMLWTNPEDILKFNNPFEDWHTAKVNINLKEGGRFYYRMEAKDGSAGFDFTGRYNQIVDYVLIECTGDDGRKTITTFASNGGATVITEVFEPESITSIELQRDFCQTILNNFKSYAEMKMNK